MTPTVHELEPALFPEDVRAFAAKHRVTGYLEPLYELTRRCFPGVEIGVRQDNDCEIADLGWIIFEVGVGNWDLDRYRAAQELWIGEFLRRVPPADRQPFILGMR